MHNRVPITVRLDSFEGPLDLLLYLIQSHELDISKISISKITDQYLAYVQLMQELNFDVASDFLVMASTLLHWKSRAILPKEEEESDGDESADDGPDPNDLIRQLLEHQLFLKIGDELGQMPRKGEDVFTRPNKRPPIERVWREMNVTDLATSYQDTVIREKKRTTILKKETVSLSDRMKQFGEELEIGKPTALSSIMSKEPDRPEVVVSFLASLELARLKKLRVHQEKTYDEIYIELLETLKSFNFDLATGFEEELREQPGLEVNVSKPPATPSESIPQENIS